MMTTRLSRPLLTLSLWLAAACAQAATDREHYRFDVLFRDTVVGEHQFDIRLTEDRTEVHSDADFVIKVLFVPIYRYQHQAREVWRNGCVAQLESNTFMGGTRYDLSIRSQADDLVVNREPGDPETFVIDSSCPGSYAYWDLERLGRDHLINAQTGDYRPTSLIEEGADDCRGTPCRRFRLRTEGLDDILLWYRAADDLWLGLAVEQDRGRLEYRLRDPVPVRVARAARD